MEEVMRRTRGGASEPAERTSSASEPAEKMPRMEAASQSKLGSIFDEILEESTSVSTLTSVGIEVQTYLASVESERLFSTASIIIDERRNRLTAEKAEMFIFLKKNLHLMLKKTDLYTPVDDDADEELDRIVSEVHRSHPNTGYKLMRGHLNARGVRVPISRLRESLHRVDAEGVYMRPLRLHVIRRRQYSVPGPNSLWHIDGHHKLIRWRFVVHGGVDGFSRLVVYLNVAGNNRASTVLQSFINAVQQYGLPSRVRSDKGRENSDVAEFMIRSRGTNRNSHITGRSVHNQRKERMWRDVYEHALDLFYQIFTSLEDQGTLNPDNEVHLYAMHRIFLPQIQRTLSSFRDASNFHGLRTERNQSPNELWRRYREQGPMEEI
ncbi:uncharacterized protein LOC132958896 [Labrus mixtus]|uniref:uncharacterized protein LOC132958896 n=1 Tax=Labrus mixtus TaxID=508554 RepID=UPI0029C07FB8|nr:uncharacterized protein LOC132958896 [Labrus mixtus]